MSEFENMPVNETAKVPETPVAPEAPELPEAPKTPEAPETPQATVDLDYILEQITAIQADTALLKETLEKIASMGPEDATKICVMKDMVMARETTNQQLLDFYMVLYNDHKRLWTLKRTGTARNVKKQPGKDRTYSLKQKVMDALQDPMLDEESRELVLDYMGQLKDLSPELQDQALAILANPALDPEEKDCILENLEAIDQLDD